MDVQQFPYKLPLKVISQYTGDIPSILNEKTSSEFMNFLSVTDVMRHKKQFTLL